MNTLRTFMYHDVRNLEDTDFPDRYKLKSFLNLEQFEFQINHIKANYDIISPEDLKNIDLTKNGNYNFAILTFDDGLSDHYDNVYPILKAYDTPGTFFIPVKQVLKNDMIHSHKIQFILAASNEKKLVKDILGRFVDSNSLWEKYSQTKWKDNWWSKEMIFVTNFLRNYKQDFFDIYEFTDFLFLKYVGISVQEFSKGFYLNNSQVKKLKKDKLITIGGHGYVSENLLLIEDIEDDIKKCAEYVKSEFISYPNGGYNEQVKDICRKNGFNYGFTINRKTITELDSIDTLELPRYDAPQKLPLP